LREAPGVGQQQIARAVDPLQKFESDAVYFRHRREARARGAPDKSLRARKIGRRRRRRRESLPDFGDAGEQGGVWFGDEEAGPFRVSFGLF